ncbi:hypothetical protein KJ840_04040 [Patescibacteria group bacterium]|nr:hypothetical protein [Patescibacteria group bacterium]
MAKTEKCPACGGSGKAWGHACQNCEGTGRILTAEAVMNRLSEEIRKKKKKKNKKRQ